MFYTNSLTYKYETADLHETNKEIMLNIISLDVLRKKGRFQKVCYISLVNYTRCTFCFSAKDLCLNGANYNKLTFPRWDVCAPHSPSGTDHLFHGSRSPHTAPQSHEASFGLPLWETALKETDSRKFYFNIPVNWKLSCLYWNPWDPPLIKFSVEPRCVSLIVTASYSYLAHKCSPSSSCCTYRRGSRCGREGWREAGGQASRGRPWWNGSAGTSTPD